MSIINRLRNSMLRYRAAKIARELIELDASDMDGLKIRHLLAEKRRIADELRTQVETPKKGQPTGQFVVKVQASLYSDFDVQQMLIYNIDRTFVIEGNISARAKHLLRGRQKVYCRAIVNDDQNIILLNEVSAQDW